MSQDHCRMHQDLCSMAQPATAGAAVAGATARGATAGVTAGRGTGGCTAWGPTFGRTAGPLRMGFSPLRSSGGLTLGLLFAVSTVGFNERPNRPRKGLATRKPGRFPRKKNVGSAITTQARDTRARRTWKTWSKILV